MTDVPHSKPAGSFHAGVDCTGNGYMNGIGLQPEEAAAGDGEGATVSSSVVTLSSWAMGCGVLALPRVFAMCGLWPGLFLLTLFAFLVDVSLRWVVACGRYSGSCSFEGNARFFLGKSGATIVHSAQIVLLLGGIVSLFVVVASLLPCIARDLISHVCDDAGDSSSDSARSWATRGICKAHPLPCIPRDQIIVAVLCLTFPLSNQSSLHALRRFSSLALGCLVYFFCMLLVRFLGSLRSSSASEIFWPSAEGLVVHAAEEGGGFWQGPPILLMSFLCHTSILRLDQELKPDARPQVASVIRTVLVHIALPVYALVGVSGYLLCGPGVSSNVLQDFEGDAWMAIARLTLGCMNMVKIPLGVITLRDVLVASLPSSRRQSMEKGMGRSLVTVAILGVSALAAASLGSLSCVLSLMGCTVGVLFSLCLPAALYWRLLRRVQKTEGIRRPLLPQQNAAACAARVADVIELPRCSSAWYIQHVECATVFLVGVLTGALGFYQWVQERLAGAA
eukprot:TRINITY_DN80745_c0_g1_i1.p1 TRINITY_DN80745_c0_g1~~TRINITY_DN80745_c0_g1_i1.p1  ORF type:complete len:507 (+),score=82.87 TRINITY_DN80745_c0_g1_i1:83-1603(+)